MWAWTTSAIVVLLGTIAFLLGCEQMFDTDIWWHVRSGEWILATRRVPWLDPFTFASADRPWIDLHWGFQVAVALAHRLAGVPGIVILAAMVSGTAFLVAFAARDRGWPIAVAGWCWVPALALMSSRFDPRPEIFSLLLMAGFLAVLFRVERSPALIWLLPLLQAVWVNVHSLFVLGPVIVSCYLVDRLVRGFLGTLSGPCGWAWWRHVGPACLALALACWLNPYGTEGVLFPGEIFGKIASPSNPYKAFVAEFMSLSSMVQKQGLPVAAANLYLRALTFLALILPWSFLVPAVWRHCRPEVKGLTGFWTATLLGCVALAAIGTLGLPARDVPGWLAPAGRFSPLCCLVLGGLAALVIGPPSRYSALLLISGAIGIAGWCDFLRGHLYGMDVTLTRAWGPALWPIVGIVGVIAILAAIAAEARPFLVLLTIAFGQLALMAYRNMNLFGLAGGVVLAWNLGSWSQALRETGGTWRSGWAKAGPAVLIALLLGWLVAIPTDRFFAMTGELRHFGWGERPYWYAHDAARFAGRPGMPDRALVFDVGQTGVYLYHNGPERKLYMDSRLEIPTLETFREYIRVEQWLQQGDARWAEAVRQMGNPLIMIAHEENADAVATLMADPRWRCVWFDPVAAVFLTAEDPRRKRDYPAVDFADRYVRACAAPTIDPVESLVEAKVLAEIGSHMARRPATRWEVRAPLLILGACHARRVLAAGGHSPQAWTILGHCCWSLAPDLSQGPPDLEDPWDPATGLSWSQAAACYRRALEQSARNVPALLSLARIYEIRRMNQAHAAVAASVRSITNQGPARAVRPLSELISALEATGAEIPWNETEWRALALLNLGAPTQARRLYERASDPPSAALQHCRIADTHLAAFALEDAERAYRQSLAQNRSLGSGWFGLCLTLLHQGHPAEALEASRSALTCTLTEPQRGTLEKLQILLARFASD